MKRNLLLAIPALAAFAALAGFSDCPKSNPVVYGVGEDPEDENLTFNLSGGGTSSVDPGESTTFQVTASTVNVETRDYNPSVTLSVEGLPSGVTSSFSVNPVNANANQSSTLTLVVENVEIQPGSYPFQIVGNNGTDEDSVNCTLIINGNGLDLQISTEDDRIYDQNYGEVDDRDAYYYITVTMPPGFTGTVALSYEFPNDNFDQGIEGTFTPQVLDFGQQDDSRVEEGNTRQAELHLERISPLSTTLGVKSFIVRAEPSGSGYAAREGGAELIVSAPLSKPSGG